MTAPLTRNRLKRLLHYSPDTGVFTWRVSRGKRKAGSVAGAMHGRDHYVRISIDGRTYWHRRLAWFYLTGKWPEHDIVSTLRFRRFVKQRTVGRTKSCPSDNRSGIQGVRWEPARGKWKVEFSVDGRKKFFGRFAKLAAARVACAQARKRWGARA